MNSIRRRIIDAIVARLGSVSGIAHCSAWRQTPYAPTELPAVIVADTTGTILSEVMGLHDHELTIEVVLMVSGATSPDAARELAAALLASCAGYETWGGLVSWTEPVSATLDSETIGDAVAAARIELQVHYRSDRWAL